MKGGERERWKEGKGEGENENGGKTRYAQRFERRSRKKSRYYMHASDHP